MAVVDMDAIVVPHNFKQIAEQVLYPSCAAFKSCHSKIGREGELNLCTKPLTKLGEVICDETSSLDLAYAALYKHASDDKTAKAEGMLLVAPCDPEKSFFMKKFGLDANATSMTPYGQRMPKDNPALDPRIVKAISDWISRGAHRDEPDNVTGTACVMGDGG